MFPGPCAGMRGARSSTGSTTSGRGRPEGKLGPARSVYGWPEVSMPAPQASAMQQFARLKFTSFNIKVPQNWQNPSGDPDAKHYGDAFPAGEKTTAPGAPPLFQPASMNKYHTDAQKMHIDKIGKFIDGICSAICSAWSTWQSAATMVGVMITGPVASVGQVVGPPWTPLILAQGPKETPMLMKYTNVVANVLGTAWLAYTATIKVPGLPW